MTGHRPVGRNRRRDGGIGFQLWSRGSAGATASELHRASRRIGLLAACLLVAVLAVVSTLVVVVVLDAQRQQTVATLDQAIATAHGGGIEQRDGDDSAVRNVAVAVTDPHGARIDGSMPAGLPDRSVMAAVARSGKVDQRQVEVGGRYYAVRTARHGDDTVQAVLDLHEQREEIARLVRAMIISASIGVVLVGVVAVWLGRRAVQPLAEALALQQRFVTDAAHELRTPLTLMSTRAQLLARRLRQTGLSEPQAHAAPDDGVAGIVGDAADLTEILEDLLLAADRSVELPKTPVDLAAVARDAVDAAEAAAAADGIRISIAAEPSGANRAWVPSGSRPALLRAANALIDNAVSHASAQVQVGVISRAGSIDLEVTDDGAGIDADTLPRIFDRFASQRPDTSHTDPAAGSEAAEPITSPARRHYGLGLALVSDVAARHHGSVTAQNRSDGHSGAMFRLRIPTAVSRRDRIVARLRR